MKIDESDRHPWNADRSIRDRREHVSKITLENVQQCAKQPAPNCVIFFAIVTSVIFPKKDSIEVHSKSITKCSQTLKAELAAEISIACRFDCLSANGANLRTCDGKQMKESEEQLTNA
jgi:hypothetical protein